MCKPTQVTPETSVKELFMYKVKSNMNNGPSPYLRPTTSISVRSRERNVNIVLMFPEGGGVVIPS